MGVRHPRLQGEEYYSLVDEFVQVLALPHVPPPCYLIITPTPSPSQALFRKYPSALLQFEDFSSDKASTLLSKYRDTHL
eukprot:scaffold73630_cov48-Phaeocystis_antarctica.AAC.5